MGQLYADALVQEIRWSGVSLDTIAEAVLADSELWRKEITFDPSSTVALRANSGRGKSSAVALLTGSRTDFDGSIKMGEISYHEATHAQWASWYKTYFSIVWQDLRLITHLTGIENVALVQTDKSFTITATEMAERLGVATVWNKPVNKLSFGERQRIAIIRALAKPFRLLILDEPFSHLDAHNRQLAASLIDEVCQQNHAGYLLTTLAETPELPADQVIKL